MKKRRSWLLISIHSFRSFILLSFVMVIIRLFCLYWTQYHIAHCAGLRFAAGKTGESAQRNVDYWILALVFEFHVKASLLWWFINSVYIGSKVISHICVGFIFGAKICLFVYGLVDISNKILCGRNFMSKFGIFGTQLLISKRAFPIIKCIFF